MKIGTRHWKHWILAPLAQILRRKRTKGAQQNIFHCAPFSIALPVAITTEVTTAFI
jgi:hypothetical protein